MSDDPPERPLGMLRAENGAAVVRMPIRLDARIAEVWSALTDPDRLAGWYGLVEGELHVGGAVRIRIEGSGWTGTGVVEACEAPTRLVLRTQEDTEPYGQTLEAVLAAVGTRTDLVVETAGMPLELGAAYGVGWQLHVEHLAAFLAGREPADPGVRWGELLPGYEALAAP